MKNNFLGNNLKYLREKNNIYQNQLANYLNVDQSTIAKWENKTREPNLDYIVKIANYFNISIGDFIILDLSKNNKCDEEIKRFATENGITIEISKNSELTSDDIIEVQKILLNELNNFSSNKNKDTSDL